MNEKYMMGDFICKLRKEKGLSQHELGHMVGVSNKAVSKWETGEANPETAILLQVASVLGVTADELLRGCRNEQNGAGCENGDNAGGDNHGGNNCDNRNEPIISINIRSLEYKSKRVTKKGVPYVHINFSSPTAKAHGVVAIGFRSKGIISIGLLSYGLISLGLLSFGLLSFGCFCFGLIAGGAVASGGLAAGGVAIGIVAVGGVAIGVWAVGGVAIGYYACTFPDGVAIGIKEYVFEKRPINPNLVPIETDNSLVFAGQRAFLFASRLFLTRI